MRLLGFPMIGRVEAMVRQQNHERAKDDAKTSNDFARVAAQSAILINGGAASATLAFIGSLARDSHVKVVLSILPLPLFIYSLGVFFAAASLLFMSKSIESYMMEWMGGEGWGDQGTKLWWVALALVTLGLMCFLAASGYLAYNLAAL
jgi:hypothetical protein